MMDLRKVLEELIPDEMSREELMAACIRQLERKPEDVEEVAVQHVKAIHYSAMIDILVGV